MAFTIHNHFAVMNPLEKQIRIPPAQNNEAKRAYNRASAAKSRKRAKEQVAELYNKLSEASDKHDKLQVESERLRQLASSLQDENQRLRTTLVVLEAQPMSPPLPPPPPSNTNDSVLINTNTSSKSRTDIDTMSEPLPLAQLVPGDLTRKHFGLENYHSDSLASTTTTTDYSSLVQLQTGYAGAGTSTATTACASAGVCISNESSDCNIRTLSNCASDISAFVPPPLQCPPQYRQSFAIPNNDLLPVVTTQQQQQQNMCNTNMNYDGPTQQQQQHSVLVQHVHPQFFNQEDPSSSISSHLWM